MVSVEAIEEAKFLPQPGVWAFLPTTAPLWTTAFAFPIKGIIRRSLSGEFEYLS